MMLRVLKKRVLRFVMLLLFVASLVTPLSVVFEKRIQAFFVDDTLRAFPRKLIHKSMIAREIKLANSLHNGIKMSGTAPLSVAYNRYLNELKRGVLGRTYETSLKNLNKEVFVLKNLNSMMPAELSFVPTVKRVILLVLNGMLAIVALFGFRYFGVNKGRRAVDITKGVQTIFGEYADSIEFRFGKRAKMLTLGKGRRVLQMLERLSTEIREYTNTVINVYANDLGRKIELGVDIVRPSCSLQGSKTLLKEVQEQMAYECGDVEICKTFDEHGNHVSSGISLMFESYPQKTK